MSEFIQHEHNGTLEFCQSLRTDTARICHVILFNKQHITLYAGTFNGLIPECVGKTTTELDSYRKLCLNESEKLQKIAWGIAND